MPTYLPIIVFIVLFFIIIAIPIVLSKKKKERKRQLAEEWGFSFEWTPNIEMHSGFKHPLFDLVNEDRKAITSSIDSAQAYNLIKGERHDLSWEISEYYFRRIRGLNIKTGFSPEMRISNEKGTTYHQTIFVVDMKKTLPSFALERKGIMARFNPVAIKNNVDFPDDSDFDKGFLVQGEDKEAIKNILNKKVREFLKEKKTRYIIVTNNSKMMVFRRGIIISPNLLDKEMKKIKEICKTFQ